METGAAADAYRGQKSARWRHPICPLTVGLGDKYAKYVTQRIRDVAAAVGAPVNADPACKPNVEVVFTTTPQGFMDGIRKTGPAFLGYHDSSSQADEMAKVTHPIQAWYTTESLDFDGAAQVDSGQCVGIGTTLNFFEIGSMQGGTGPITPIILNLSCARIMHATGSRLGNGYDSGFNNVLILAEPAKLSDFEVGSLADYITHDGAVPGGFPGQLPGAAQYFQHAGEGLRFGRQQDHRWRPRLSARALPGADRLFAERTARPDAVSDEKDAGDRQEQLTRATRHRENAFMKIRHIVFLAACVVVLVPCVATSQTAPTEPSFALPPESITVISTKPSVATIESFVEARGMRTHALDRMARWALQVCPLTVGLRDKYADYVTRRIRDIAAAVGAPVSTDPACQLQY